MKLQQQQQRELNDWDMRFNHGKSLIEHPSWEVIKDDDGATFVNVELVTKEALNSPYVEYLLGAHTQHNPGTTDPKELRREQAESEHKMLRFLDLFLRKYGPEKLEEWGL